MLSQLLIRRIAALLTESQTGDFDGLTAQQALDLDEAVCREIINELDIKAADITFYVPTRSLGGAVENYRAPLELFTVNYDLLLETALDRLKVPYFDGFIGAFEGPISYRIGRNQPSDMKGEVIPAFFVRLWKLHGSVHWTWDDDRQVVRLGQPVEKGTGSGYVPFGHKVRRITTAYRS